MTTNAVQSHINRSTMDNNPQPASCDQGSRPESEGSKESSPQRSSGDKRPASDTKQPDGQSAMAGQQTQDGSPRSSKRQKVDGSLEETRQSGSKSPRSGDSTPHAGWNQGVSRGLRISFGAKSRLSKQPSPKTPGSPAQPSVDSADLNGSPSTNADQVAGGQGAASAELDSNNLPTISVQAKEASAQESPAGSRPSSAHSKNSASAQQRGSQAGNNASTPRGTQGSDDWAIPAAQSAVDFAVDGNDERGWEEKFVSWCRSLHQLNHGKIKANIPRERNRVVDAYVSWVGTIDGLKKKKVATARRVAIDYARDHANVIVSLFSEPLALTVEPAPETQPAAQPGEPAAAPQEDGAQPSTATSPGEVSDENTGPDLEHQERYYPGIDAKVQFCTMCASRGHRVANCPAMPCRFCQTAQHRSFSCQTRQRCDKCEQLGHSKLECTEKLKLPADQRECAFCGSRDHADASCHELWRSYVFEAHADAVQKVRHLPVYCYFCGSEGHYGGACSANSKRPREGPWETWSLVNCTRYMDPASTDAAIIYGGGSSQANWASSDRPDLGKSIVPQRHIFIEDSDDDDEAEQFIRPPVQKAQKPRGGSYINFSSSRTGNQYQQTDRRGGQAQAPSGLPPHIPPPSFQDRNRRGGGGRRGRGGR
ncbi:hypothetical protein VTJ83DRAFT_7401 [Remersonia thermophila]|uniref:CCHC-type domain-containing protein n=1 Tax=Remersonia thermophila TaxID=72144 RepID=A0ABR4D4X5_9PEZI